MDNRRPKIICLTPVKNEAWILDKFLRCTSIWADNIIILDQNSTDDSRIIAKKFPKVRLIINKNNVFNEKVRQDLLIKEARKIELPRLLITLDADEFLTSNFINNPEWDMILRAEKSTIIKFRCVNVLPDMIHYWVPDFYFPWAYIDDNSSHKGRSVHSPRIPVSEKNSIILLKDIKVLHYQYTDWERMESKHRWYQCWERINDPKKSSVDIYRQYHHMHSIKKEDIKVIPEIWFSEYLKRGIDIKNITKEIKYYWDEEVIGYFNKYGTSFFKKEYIWDIDWNKKAREYGYNINFGDPRNLLQKIIHSWLKKTQMDSRKLYVRVIDKLLKKIFGW